MVRVALRPVFAEDADSTGLDTSSRDAKYVHAWDDAPAACSSPPRISRCPMYPWWTPRTCSATSASEISGAPPPWYHSGSVKLELVFPSVIDNVEFRAPAANP